MRIVISKQQLQSQYNREISASVKIDLSLTYWNFNTTRLICEPTYKFLSLRWKLYSTGITVYLQNEFWYGSRNCITTICKTLSIALPFDKWRRHWRVTFPFPLRATRINSTRATSPHTTRSYANFHHGARITPATINRQLIVHVDPLTLRYRAPRKSECRTSRSIANQTSLIIVDGAISYLSTS